MNANAEFVSYISKTRRVLSESRPFYSLAHTPHFSVELFDFIFIHLIFKTRSCISYRD